MLRWLAVAALAVSACGAQDSASEKEQDDLRRALSEAGSSPIEFIRALESHLNRYPNTPNKADIDRALVKAAIEARDNRRIVLYGERVLAREDDDLQVLERVARALLASDDRESAQKALKYARQFEKVLRSIDSEKPPDRREQLSGHEKARMREEIDTGLCRALVFQARALGNLGNIDEAISAARRSFAMYPTAESAREIGRWLARSGKDMEAAAAYADAFTIPDPRATEADRAAARAKMGELYRKAKGSEQGLGDIVLAAYDRNSALMSERRLRERQYDVNAQLTDPMDFTLSGLSGDKLALASLKGKVIVLDFWATWCGPCRAQHPLYEQVKKKFQGRGDVLFLSISTDHDREAVEPFVQENRWSKTVYFDDGLAALLRITSIPTTVILDKRGQVASRMNGFVPERFVDMLAERIENALRASE